MATPEDQKDIAENTENPEEEKEDEEPVDLELQKEMKGLKVVDSDFTNELKTKKVNKKTKNQEDKKGKKKGQDFIDYANKNNIQINIEYEENKYQLKKKNRNIINDNKRQYNKGGYKNNKNYQQKIPKYTGNKFDIYGQRMPQHNYNQHPTPKLVENKEILEYLEKIFGESNLNKDTYIRNRLKDGKISIDEIVAYNDIKRNNISAQKIIEIIKDSQNLEIVNEENKTYIKIKNFDKLNLLTLEQIIANKKAARMQKMQYSLLMGQQSYPYNGYSNFINMQNNNYFYKFPNYNYLIGGYTQVQESK